MSTDFEAIYEAGVFKPLTPVDLPDGARVQLHVEADAAEMKIEVDAAEIAQQQRAAAELLDWIELQSPATAGEPTSAEDHDLYLYGWRK